MTDYSLQAKPTLDNFSLQSNGVTWREITGYTLLSIAPYRHRRDDVEALLHSMLGLGLSAPGQAGFVGQDAGVSIISAARDQWFLRISGDDREVFDDLKVRLQPMAALTDQSDAWVQIELRGVATAPVLERLFPIDLHPDYFPIGAAARTMVEHLGVIITRLPMDEEAARRYLLFSPSSSARSFVQVLRDA